MTDLLYQDIGGGITRIDTTMVRNGLAACYLLEANGRYAIIETGTHHTVPVILALLAQRQIAREQVDYVIPTHVHLDHAGGVGGLMQALPSATLLVHPRGARHLIDPARLKAGVIAVYGEATFARVYGDILPVAAERVRSMNDASWVQLGDRRLVFYDTPGHAKHHFCVYDPTTDGIFTGDTFGLSYPELTTVNGRFVLPTTTPVQFQPQALKASIDRLLALHPRQLYLTHYGKLEGDLPALGEQLKRMVDDYVHLAKQPSDACRGEALVSAIKPLLSGYLLTALDHHGADMSNPALRQLLEMDIDLNAQGLAVWRAGLTH